MRSWWRHEQQFIRMALGAAAHHSAQQYAARRGPKTGTRAREGEVLEKYAACGAPQGTPSLAGAAGEAVDAAALAFLLSQSLAAKEHEEEERGGGEGGPQVVEGAPLEGQG